MAGPELPPGLFDVERQLVHGADVLVFENPVVDNARDILELAHQQPPERPYLIHGDQQVTFGELVGLVGGLATELIESWGAEPGDRIAISAANSIDWALIAWAAMASGRIVVGANAWWHADETLNALSVTDPTILVVDGPRLRLLVDRLDEVSARHIAVIGEVPDDITDPRIAPIRPLGVTPKPLPSAAVDTDDTATILFTSGTTGNAKGVIGTHRAIAVTYQSVMHTGATYFPTVGLRNPAELPPPSPPCSVLSAPMFHVAGLQWGLMFPVGMGSTTVLHTGRYEADAVLDLVVRHRCTSLGGVPTMLTRVVDHPGLDRFDLSTITSVSWGGAPPPSGLAEQCRATFPNLNLVGTGYGLTETCGLMLYAAGTDYIERPLTAGKPMVASEVRICGPDDRPLDPGDEGEIQLRGAMVMPGYWNNPDASADALTADGWLRTGDLGRIDADGFVTITGRAKELIIRGGENVYPVEIEDVLVTHPAVLDAAVVGRPHPDLGEEVVAVVHISDDAVTEAALQTHVSERLARFKVPVEIVRSTEPLPRNAAGKLLRDAIAGGTLRLTETL